MPSDANLGFAFGLKPQAALDYFRSKGYRVNSAGWAAVEAESHKKAFTVARVAAMDVLVDIRKAVDQAINDGTTLAEFQKKLMPQLKSKGWWGLSPDGVQLGSPQRLETIFRTNIQTAYMEGRWRGLMENVDDRPWFQYVAVMDSRTRPQHAALHGKVFRYDDPFWRTMRPPLGWNCRCRLRALTDDDLEIKGLKPESGASSVTVETRTAQGYPQPQASYRDPRTGQAISTDVGWGYDRNTGYAPPVDSFPADLHPIVQEITQEAMTLSQSVYDAAIVQALAAPPVTIVSSPDDIRAWIAELQGATQNDATRQAIIEAKTWLMLQGQRP